MSFTACNSSKNAGANPFFAEWTTPYGVPPFDSIRTEHYMPAFERAMSLHEAEIDAIVTNKETPTFENTLLAYDNSGKMLSKVNSVFGMLCSAETNDEMQALQEKVMPMLSAHSDKIMLNDKLFARIKNLHDGRATLGIDSLQMRLLEKTYKSFVRSGALLDAKQKERLQKINEELSITGVKFGNNLLAENNNFTLALSTNELDGLPESVRDAAFEKGKEKGLKDKYVFTLQKPSMLPFLTNSTRRDLRKKLYNAYLTRCNHDDKFDNKQLINDFCRLRLEKAKLLGYTSYADYVISDQMAGTPRAALDLLEGIWTPALARAKEELKEMDSLLQIDKKGATFEASDWWYYAEKVRKQKYNLDEGMLRPYFSLQNAQSGIFFLANRLYGITFRPISVPIYHPDVTAYEVLDADESHLGVLYFDFFPRAGKSGGAWCGNYTEQTYENGKRVAPVLAIVCNFTPPTQNGSALLTLDETETLFHEFGHALHFLFHNVKYRGLAEVEGDFVELPSQVMENWAFEPEVLRQYATNVGSGEVIPDYMIDKLRQSQYFNQGFITTELLASSLTDLTLHNESSYAPFDVNAYEKKVLDKLGLIPQIAPRYHYTYFSHIFDGGYTAGYYFYTWAEVLDKDAFQAFRESGDLFNRSIATKFRTLILERGGEADGMTMYRAFRGADPDKNALLKARGLWVEPEVPAEQSDDQTLQSPIQLR
ncbi:MAG: M3 family metallopeptidase [Alistipes sp.]